MTTDYCIHDMPQGLCGLCDPPKETAERNSTGPSDAVAKPGGYNADLVRKAIEVARQAKRSVQNSTPWTVRDPDQDRDLLDLAEERLLSIVR